jgi:hypothetical protein
MTQATKIRKTQDQVPPPPRKPRLPRGLLFLAGVAGGRGGRFVAVSSGAQAPLGVSRALTCTVEVGRIIPSGSRSCRGAVVDQRGRLHFELALEVAHRRRERKPDVAARRLELGPDAQRTVVRLRDVAPQGGAPSSESIFETAPRDDDVLAHHPAILVLQEVAVEHVRGIRVGVAAEADE